jgi:ABC-2 type transport system ATP-binding protein
MIEAQELSKHYGPFVAVADLSFEVPEGKIVGFLGPNAAGKSTTMRVLTGYMPATSGTARVAGYDVHESPLEVKQRVGYLPESVPLYNEMTVTGFLRYVAEVKSVPRGSRMLEVGRVIERCALQEVSRRIIGHLSKGYRQRVGLAQALVGSPPVLILDEPTVGLDPAQIIEIREMIRGLAADHTILLSSHVLPEVEMLCDRVLIIHRGRLVAEESLENEASQSNLVEIEVEAAATAVPLLLAVEGVAEARPVGARHVLVVAKPDVDVREEAIQVLVESGQKVRGATYRRRSLEEIFMGAIAADAETAGAPAVAAPGGQA